MNQEKGDATHQSYNTTPQVDIALVYKGLTRFETVKNEDLDAIQNYGMDADRVGISGTEEEYQQV